MSNFRTAQVIEDDSLSPSSDEKMDTGSESFRSQDTPNSILSSDFEDKSETNVLRLQNPQDEVLRLSQPEDNGPKITQELSDSFVTKLAKLHLDSPLENRPRNLAVTPPKNLGTSPPKFSSSLVMTVDHPLMSSPDDFPDLIPKKISKDEEKDLSLSSIEDEKPIDTNGYEFYSPQINTSKNNLYYSDNFTTADSNMLSESKMDNGTPDVARVEQQRRKIKPRFIETPQRLDNMAVNKNTPQRVLGRIVDGNRDEDAVAKYIEERDKRLSNQSTPILHRDESEIPSSVAEWCESTHILASPIFDLPIELSTNVAVNNALESDVLSSSTQEDRSLYQALLDPYTGSVALRPRAAPRPHSPNTRRKIQLPPEDDQCSLDSLNVSMESEDEPPELDPDLEEDRKTHSDEDLQRSKSSNTVSEYSEPIPEYSAAEEFHNERSFVSVRTGDTHATCDMKVIEPYKRVLSHGGYDAAGAAVIVFSACHLPDTRRPDYGYVMDNLFLYVVWSLERLIGSEYVLVYLHGSAGSRRLPRVRWLLECYRLVDHRLRKSLKHLYLVHPTFWLKSFVIITKPFVSSKFFHKLSYVNSLEQLHSLVPVEPNAIPDIVRQFDQRR